MRENPEVIRPRRRHRRPRGLPARERLLRVILLLLVLGSVPAAAHFAAPDPSLTAAPNEVPIPGELSAAIKEVLATPGAKVQSGTTILEFWWVKSLDASGTGEGWGRVPEGSLVGAVRVSEAYRDIRGRRIQPGVYTLRYALQPMNGDHLGVSPHREFLLISPGSADSDTKPTGFQGTVDLSKQTTGAAHPAAWSIDPPVATGAALSTYTNDAGHQGVVFEVRSSAGPLKFGLILIGKIDA